MDAEETKLYIKRLEKLSKEITKDKKRSQEFQARLGVYDAQGNLTPQYK